MDCRGLAAIATPLDHATEKFVTFWTDDDELEPALHDPIDARIVVVLGKDRLTSIEMDLAREGCKLGELFFGKQVEKWARRQELFYILIRC